MDPNMLGVAITSAICSLGAAGAVVMLAYHFLRYLRQAKERSMKAEAEARADQLKALEKYLDSLDRIADRFELIMDRFAELMRRGCGSGARPDPPAGEPERKLDEAFVEDVKRRLAEEAAKRRPNVAPLQHPAGEMPMPARRQPWRQDWRGFTEAIAGLYVGNIGHSPLPNLVQRPCEDAR